MRSGLLVLVLCVALQALETQGVIDYEEIWKDYNHIETACDVGNCVGGGCLFTDCKEKVTCTGGMCFFRNCASAVCQGGACMFDHVTDASCPGGACKFSNMKRTLTDGYCDGGACKLEGEDHPTNFEAQLSQ